MNRTMIDQRWMPHTARRWGRAAGAAAITAVALLHGAPANAQANARGAPVQAATHAEASAPAGVVNLNTATGEELERLPGVGPSKAQAILAMRQRVGRFARVEDILRVRGIGRATFRRLRPMLALQGNTTLSASASRVRAPERDEEASSD